METCGIPWNNIWRPPLPLVPCYFVSFIPSCKSGNHTPYNKTLPSLARHSFVPFLSWRILSFLFDLFSHSFQTTTSTKMRYLTAVITSLALATTALATSSTSLEKRSLTPVTITGNAFFAGSTRFYIRGVDYQPGEHYWIYSSNNL